MSESPRIEERVARSVLYVVTSRVIIQLFATISGVLVARWLSPQDYGVLALAVTATIAVSMLGDLSVGAAIILFRDLEATELNAWRGRARACGRSRPEQCSGRSSSAFSAFSSRGGGRDCASGASGSASS